MPYQEENPYACSARFDISVDHLDEGLSGDEGSVAEASLICLRDCVVSWSTTQFRKSSLDIGSAVELIEGEAVGIVFERCVIYKQAASEGITELFELPDGLS